MNRTRATMPRLVVGLLGVALLGGCTTSGDSAAPVPSKGLPAAPTAWDTTTATLDGGGRLALPTALTAFALAVGPVPGAAPVEGPKGPINSASLAVVSVLARWGELSDAQRTAVRAALGVPKDRNAPAAYREAPAGYRNAPAAYRKAPATTANPDLPCQSADSAGAEPYRAQVAGILGDLTARLGRPLKVADRLFLTVNTTNIEKEALMYVYPCHGVTAGADGDSVDGCTLHLNPRSIGGVYTAAETRSFMVHEIMHCYLLDRFGMAYDDMPAWYLEGVPTWVMSDIGGSNFPAGAYWKKYLDTPATPLSARSYDGLGFFAHLAESGAQVWKLIDPIGAALVGHGTPAGWAAAAPSAGFLDSWGSGYVQGRYPGPAWTSTGSGLPPYQPALPGGRLGDGQTLAVTAPGYAAAVRRIDVDAEIVTITPGAGTTGRISIGAGKDAPLTGGPFCTRGSCACPGGSPTFPPMASGDTFLGASAGNRPASVVLAGSTLAEACAKPQASCLVGNWTASGFAASLSVAESELTETGGAGVKMTIDSTGATKVVFNGMQPVRVTGKLTGTVLLHGSLSGAIRLPAPGVTEGAWQTTKAGRGAVTADASWTAPVKVNLNHLSVNDLASSMGGMSPLAPLATGTWRCTADTLVSLSSISGFGTGSWTLTRDH